MKRPPAWLSIEFVIALHESLLDEHGGSSGVRDQALLESALARPKHLLAYENADLFTLAAAYADGIVNNHPFIDGNKRTGFMAAYTFLETNGQQFTAPEPQVVSLTVSLADKSVSRTEYAQWLKASCVKKKKKA